MKEEKHSQENQQGQENVQNKDSSGANQNPFLVPFAIIVAGIIIAASIIFAFSDLNKKFNNSDNLAVNKGNSAPQKVEQPSISNINPVTSDDHIRGNPNARIKIVEFSDLECPFCKRFHFTMKKILSTYGDKVAWVYRHDPIPQLHSKAFSEAVASECAADQGGNDAFWKYVDRVFEITPSNNQLEPSQLETIAQELGLNLEKFRSCLSSGKYDQKIQSHIDDAIKSGPRATPYSVVIVDNKPTEAIEGAYDFQATKQILDSILSRLQ